MPIFSAILGWVFLGAIATTVLITFWDQVKDWLNNVAANAVEKAFGYTARKYMHKAVAIVDKVMGVVRNKSTVYTKTNSLDKYFVKTDILAKAPASKIDEGVLEEIKKEGKLVQEFGYNG